MYLISPSPYSLAAQTNTQTGVIAPPVAGTQAGNAAGVSNPMVLPTAQPKSGGSGGIGIGDIPGGSSISNSGIFSGAKNAINNFGLNNLGIGSSVGPTPLSAGFGGAPATGSLSGASLTGVLGSAAGGFGVGGLTSGLLGGNTKAGSIAGGLGSGAMALAGFGGPASLLVGAGVGALAGGLFKKKPSDKTQSGGVGINTGQVNPYYAKEKSMTGEKFSEDNANLRNQYETGIANYVNYLREKGAVANNTDPARDLIIQVGSRDGLKAWMLGDQNANRYGKDPKTFSHGVVDLLNKEYNLSPELQAEVKTMLESGKLDDISKFGQSQSQAQGQVGTGFGTPPTMPVRRASNAESFSDFVKRYNTTGATTPKRA